MSETSIRTFFGNRVDAELSYQLAQTNRHLLTLFLSGGLYLERLEFEDQLFLGKSLNSCVSLQQLENFESHILSLLKRLAPLYPHPSPRLIAFSSLIHS